MICEAPGCKNELVPRIPWQPSTTPRTYCSRECRNRGAYGRNDFLFPRKQKHIKPAAAKNFKDAKSLDGFISNIVCRHNSIWTWWIEYNDRITLREVDRQLEAYGYVTHCDPPRIRRG